MTRINCSGDNKEAKKKLNIKRQPSIRLIATITILISNAWHENLAFLCGIFRDYILQQTYWNSTVVKSKLIVDVFFCGTVDETDPERQMEN